MREQKCIIGDINIKINNQKREIEPNGLIKRRKKRRKEGEKRKEEFKQGSKGVSIKRGRILHSQ